MPEILFDLSEFDGSVDTRLLPYWKAVKDYRRGLETMEAEYYWLYVVSNPQLINGKAASEIMESLPYHLNFKMAKNFNVA